MKRTALGEMETNGDRERGKKARKTGRMKGRKMERKRKIKPESRGTAKNRETTATHKVACLKPRVLRNPFQTAWIPPSGRTKAAILVRNGGDETAMNP